MLNSFRKTASAVGEGVTGAATQVGKGVTGAATQVGKGVTGAASQVGKGVTEAAKVVTREGSKGGHGQGSKEGSKSKGPSSKAPRKVKSGGISAEVLDGRKVKALLKDEKEFVSFLNKYFDLLDKDAGGTLTRDELKPALIRFGTILGLPSPGTASDTDAMVDKLFTALMSDNLQSEIDRETFVNISQNFLTSVATSLEEKPLVVHVFDGSVLHELAENEELFDHMVDDFFLQFDEDGSGKLARDEIMPALVALGLVPPSGAKPEADALVSQIMGKYAGKDLELSRMEFKKLLKDMMKELSVELKSSPIVVGTDALPVLSVSSLRSLIKNPARIKALGDAVFQEWDTLKKGRITKSDVMKGFKDLCQSYNVPLLDEEQAEVMCLSACMFMNADADATGFVERDEFDPLLADILTKLAERLETDPRAAAAASTQTSAPWLRGWLRSDSLSSTEEASKPESAPEPAPKVLPAPSARTAKPAGKPGLRSAADIKAAYNYQPSEAVVKAREKLEERQRKIQETADNAQNLEDDAADFEELSKQLAEKMKTKWW